METFSGKTVAITGGATGIGFALARRLGAEGANVVIGEPRQNQLDEAAERLSNAGVAVTTMVMDVSDPSSMEAFADCAWNAFGSVHLLINNAGISIGRNRVTDTPLEDLHKLFDVNLFGVWHGVASFGRRMVGQGEPAAIYNLGSENSFFTAVPQSAAYVASKHAVRGLTEAMREDFPDFITLGLICPGFVKSEMTPPPFGDMAMDTDEFARRVVAQIKAREFYIVTHAYNIERIKPIHDQIEQSYAKNAERYDGDEEYDVRTLIQRFAAQRAK